VRALPRHLVLLILVHWTASTAALAQTTFSTEVVVSDAKPGCNPSLAIGSDGSPFIAYNRVNPMYALLAHESGGTWETEEISQYAWLFATRALALTSAGDPVVAFAYNDLARVGTRSGGVWSFENFDGYSPWWMTLAVDHADNPHVSYVWSWGTGEYQGYFHYDHEGISYNVFVPVNTSCSLAMDSNNRPHIAFTPTEGAPMLYWSKPSHTWVSEVLPVGSWCVIALDSAENVHLVYYDHVAGDLVYGMRFSQAWHFESVDVDGDVGMLPSLAIDADGNVHVSYYDVTHKNLKYASKKFGVWNTVTVDEIGDVGLPSSIALDSGRGPAIAYFDATNQDIKLAVAKETVPVRPVTWGSIKAMYEGQRR
jgi:hypothetical protein